MLWDMDCFENLHVKSALASKAGSIDVLTAAHIAGLSNTTVSRQEPLGLRDWNAYKIPRLSIMHRPIFFLVEIFEA